MGGPEAEPTPFTPPEFITFEQLPFAQRRAIQLALGGSVLSVLLNQIAFDHQDVMYVDGTPLSAIPPEEVGEMF